MIQRFSDSSTYSSYSENDQDIEKQKQLSGFSRLIDAAAAVPFLGTILAWRRLAVIVYHLVVVVVEKLGSQRHSDDLNEPSDLRGRVEGLPTKLNRESTFQYKEELSNFFWEVVPFAGTYHYFSERPVSSDEEIFIQPFENQSKDTDHCAGDSFARLQDSSACERRYSDDFDAPQHDQKNSELKRYNSKIFKQGLEKWENEVNDSVEKRNRLAASKKMIECFANESSQLNLSGNQLTSLPLEIGDLVKLETLNLSGNQLTSLPLEIGDLVNLETLNLSGNQLISLPLEIGDLVKLETLNLSGNQLISLPLEIGGLVNLKTLNLYANQLTSLPSEIGGLVKLEILDLFINRLTSLPSEIGGLVKLGTLNLNGNQLTSLPKEIFDLNGACSVYIKDGRLLDAARSNLNERIRSERFSGPRFHFSTSSNSANDNSTIEALFKDLCTASGENNPISLKHTKNDYLRMWLSRFLSMADSKNKPGNVAKLMYQFISKAEEDESFRTTFFSCIEGAAETCGDKMTLSILYLGLNYEIDICKEKNDLPKLAYLLGHGVWVLDTLAGIAREKAKSLNNFNDIVELYLSYPIKLKDSLKIPIQVEKMYFFPCGYVSDDELETVKDFILLKLTEKDLYFEFLVGNDVWIKALEAHRRDEYNVIKRSKEQSIAVDNPDYTKIGDDYKAKLKELTGKVLCFPSLTHNFAKYYQN